MNSKMIKTLKEYFDTVPTIIKVDDLINYESACGEVGNKSIKQIVVDSIKLVGIEDVAVCLDNNEIVGMGIDSDDIYLGYTISFLVSNTGGSFRFDGDGDEDAEFLVFESE